MTDNRTTELLQELSDLACDIHAAEIIDHVHITNRGWTFDSQWLDSWHAEFDRITDKLEQAIAATLGNHPTKSGRGYYTDRDDDGTHIMCDDCGGYIGTAEEIAATLGSGTCRIEERNGDWYCDACGDMVGTCDPASELFIDGNAVELWNYCPNCGARVRGGGDD